MAARFKQQIDYKANVPNSIAPVLPGKLPVASARSSPVCQAGEGQCSSLKQSHTAQRSQLQIDSLLGRLKLDQEHMPCWLGPSQKRVSHPSAKIPFILL